MIAALALGLLVGVVLGLVGAGGSIIAVPALVYGVGMSTHEAIPTSLLVVGASSVAAVLPRIRNGVNWRIALVVGAAGIPAAWAGTAIGRLLDENMLMLAFAVIMVAASTRMLAETKKGAGHCSAGEGSFLRSCLPRALAVGLGVGFLTGLLGVGGGFLIVPALTLFLGMAMTEAVGTSLVIIAVNSAAGFSAHAAGFTIDWATTLTFAVPAIAGSLAAARLAHRLKSKHVRIAFAILIFAVAAAVAVNSLITIFSS